MEGLEDDPIQTGTSRNEEKQNFVSFFSRFADEVAALSLRSRLKVM